MEISFCCTNLDLYTFEDFSELARMGLPLQTVHCLGLCHYCAQGKLALVDDVIVIGDGSAGFLQTLLSLSPVNGYSVRNPHPGENSAAAVHTSG